MKPELFAAHAAVDALRPEQFPSPEGQRAKYRDEAIERMNKYLSEGVTIDWNYVGELVERCYAKPNQDFCGND
jgi:hypothetical protein